MDDIVVWTLSGAFTLNLSLAVQQIPSFHRFVFHVIVLPSSLCSHSVMWCICPANLLSFPISGYLNHIVCCTRIFIQLKASFSLDDISRLYFAEIRSLGLFD